MVCITIITGLFFCKKEASNYNPCSYNSSIFRIMLAIKISTNDKEGYCNGKTYRELAGTSTGTQTPTFKIGGTVTGVINANLTLKINNVDIVNITALGSFLSATSYTTGSAYTVTVDVPNSVPNKCAITNGTGTITSADITNITINCRAFKYIFPTTSGGSGNLGGIAGADSTCNGHGARPDTTSNYKALIALIGVRIACAGGTDMCAGVSATRLDWVLYPNTEYRRADGTTIIATSNADRVFTFSLTNSFTGVAGVYSSGLNGGGLRWTASNNNCNSWTHANMAYNGEQAELDNTDVTSIYTPSTSCFTSQIVLCVEQ